MIVRCTGTRNIDFVAWENIDFVVQGWEILILRWPEPAAADPWVLAEQVEENLAPHLDSAFGRLD